MLTIEKLKEMELRSVFARGEIVDSPDGINMSNSGKMLKWVAVRGVIHDWTIYCHFASKDYDWIRSQGDKVGDPNNIKRLVPCDDEAFEMYRG